MYEESSTINSISQKVKFAFIVFFVISFALFNNSNPVSSIKEGIVTGTGYGNNGERFGSFITCSGSNSLHYFKGSNIDFKTSLNDNSLGNEKSDTSIGSWVINFITDDSQSPAKIAGLIIESNVDHNGYRLLGKETFDNVCNNIGNIITLTGECGENKRITFSDSNYERVGSIIPPHGDKIYHLFGSKVSCD